jgi:dihydropteroate synthase
MSRRGKVDCFSSFFTFLLLHLCTLMRWLTSRRNILLDRPLVMGILNITPDSFSDGGKFVSVNDALRQAEQIIEDGADIIDIGGESTRPGSSQVPADEEIRRVVPVIEAIEKRFDVPISIDSSKSSVAEAAVTAGAEIINDIAGLRWDEHIAAVAAKHETGLVLMHSRGEFATMHSQPPADNIIDVVAADLRRAVMAAEAHGVSHAQIVLDVGIGFGKTAVQNLELLAKLDKLVGEFERFPFLVGASRKSFIGTLLGDVPPDKRLIGSLVSVAVAVWNGAKIVRAHDVKETAEAVKMVRGMLGQL